MSDKNIDKDIEILKQRLEPNRYGGKCALGYSEKYCFGVNDMKAIENVLSELEIKDKKLAEYRKFHDRRLKAWNKRIENQEKHFLNELDEHDKELETWKKIAEKLANSIVSDEKILALTCKRIINKTEDECLEQNCLCDECIIDWARKEVENEKRNS